MIVIENVNVFINEDCRPRLRLVAIGPITEQYITRPLQETPRMEVNMKDTQQGTLTYAGQPVDKKGFPTSIQPGTVKFNTSDPAVVSGSVVSEDPIVLGFKAGNPGDCFVWPSADADLGEGDTEVIGEKVAFRVGAGLAASLGTATVSPLEEQPDVTVTDGPPA